MEKRFREGLEERGIVYKKQVQFGRFVIDFLIGKLVIEVDGDYWHNKPGIKERDLRKDTFLKSKGYAVLRFTETQIKTELDKCLDKTITHIPKE